MTARGVAGTVLAVALGALASCRHASPSGLSAAVAPGREVVVRDAENTSAPSAAEDAGSPRVAPPPLSLGPVFVTLEDGEVRGYAHAAGPSPQHPRGTIAAAGARWARGDPARPFRQDSVLLEIDLATGARLRAMEVAPDIDGYTIFDGARGPILVMWARRKTDVFWYDASLALLARRSFSVLEMPGNPCGIEAIGDRVVVVPCVEDKPTRVWLLDESGSSTRRDCPAATVMYLYATDVLPWGDRILVTGLTRDPRREDVECVCGLGADGRGPAVLSPDYPRWTTFSATHGRVFIDVSLSDPPPRWPRPGVYELGEDLAPRPPELVTLPRPDVPIREMRFCGGLPGHAELINGTIVEGARPCNDRMGSPGLCDEDEPLVCLYDLHLGYPPAGDYADRDR